MPKQLTYREAAKRVGRSTLTIKRWRRRGLLPMGWAVQNGQRVRVVTEVELLRCFRDRLKADPVHQKIMARERQKVQVGDRMEATPGSAGNTQPGA